MGVCAALAGGTKRHESVAWSHENQKAQGYSSVVEHLPRVHDALSLIPSTVNKQNQNQNALNIWVRKHTEENDLASVFFSSNAKMNLQVLLL